MSSPSSDRSRPHDAGVALRRVCAADDAALADLFADPDVALWNPGPAPADVPRWRAENSVDADDFRTRVITDSTGRFLGLVSVFSIEDERHTAEVGFRVMPGARGRGVGRAGLELAVQLAAERDVRVVEAWHAVGNAASCAVLGACGFRFTDEVPANYEYGDGVRHDEHRHVRKLHAR